MARGSGQDLRFGFTTGACAAAGAKAAMSGLLTGRVPTAVEITLPRGERVTFEIVEGCVATDGKVASATVQKDAGDDPDVTHGAMIVTSVRVSDAVASAGTSPAVSFRAGDGVGHVTRPGLPLDVGEPAINPVPRSMIAQAVAEACEQAGHLTPSAIEVTISVPGGEALAAKTWNPRLGIAGGISILGTTGIVRPFSCAAWIASIHRGIDVARANGVGHAVGSTGATSERVAQARFGLADHAMLDMGDFAGGLLKYLKRHPLPRLTIAGGFGKLTKLAQGALDLHSSRSQIDFERLTVTADAAHRDAVREANTAQHALEIAGPELAATIAARARVTAQSVLEPTNVELDVLIVDRKGNAIAEADADGARVLA